MSIRETGSGIGGTPPGRRARQNSRLINDLAELPAIRLELGKEGSQDGHVRAGGSFAPQVCVDYPPAGIDGDGVAEIVRGVENGPGRFAGRSVLVLAEQSHGRPFNPSILRTG